MRERNPPQAAVAFTFGDVPRARYDETALIANLTRVGVMGRAGAAATEAV